MSKFTGKAKVRRFLANIEPAMRTEMLEVLDAGGRQLLTAMRSQAPSSRVQAALSLKLYPKSLRMRVGLIGKAINRRLFFAGILEFGRGLKKTTDRIGRRIGVIQPARYVYGPRTDLRAAIRNRVRGSYDRALRRAATGAGNAD